MRRARAVVVVISMLATLAVTAPAASAGESVPQLPPSDPSTVLVRLDPGAREAAALGSAGLSPTGTEAVGHTGWLEVPTDGRPVEDVLADLEDAPGIADAEPNVLVEIEGGPTNDPIYKTDQFRYFRTIRAEQAWTVATGADNVTVAILDTGVDLDHPDLIGRLVDGTDIVNGDRSPADDNGHGTFVAGVAGATTRNKRGIASPMWRGHVMPIKVLSANGSGKVADIARGLDYAVEHGADVINMSFGGTATAAVMDEAIARAVAADVVLVAGTGNDGFRGTPTYPAALPGVLAVGATKAGGTIAGFSNTGSYVDLVAPGVGIRSTYWAASEAYGVGDGTSFSTPLVASTAALLRVKYPAESAIVTAARLTGRSRDAGPVGKDAQYGNGILDAYASITAPA